MFKRTKPNLIESDEGFSIEEFTGRAGKLIYCEGEKRASIDGELLVDSALYMINPYKISTWDPPYESVEINREKIDQIVDNIRRAYHHFGYEIQVYEWDLAYHGPWTEEDFNYFKEKGFRVHKNSEDCGSE